MASWIKAAVFFILTISALFGGGASVLAHQPVIVGASRTVNIEKPDVSKAYYGELTGSPVVYTINSSVPFELYVNLLLPSLTGIKTDKSAVIIKDDAVVENMYGPDYFWSDYYEPFGDDYYLKGPEYDVRVVAGIYYIKVSSPDNLGKYVLAVGKKEKTGIGESLKTMQVLPKIKKEFFGKSPWTAYNNYTGLIAFIALVLLALAAYFTIVYCKRRQVKSKLDKAYEKLKDDDSLHEL